MRIVFLCLYWPVYAVLTSSPGSTMITLVVAVLIYFSFAQKKIDYIRSVRLAASPGIQPEVTFPTT